MHFISESNKKVIAHLIEGYAATGESYVYEQVNFASAYTSVLMAEWRLTHRYDPVTPAQRLSVFRNTFGNPLNERVARFLARRILEWPYLRYLNSFFARRLQQYDACLVHAHFGMMGVKALPAVKTLKLPLVVTFYGVDGSQAVRDPYWRPRLSRMLSVADKVVVLCDEVGDRLVDLGCDRAKLLVWNIGIKVEDYPYRPPRMVLTGKPVKFLTVARFVEKKGYEYLLRAFRNVVKNNCIEATLTIAGNGPLGPKIQQWISDYGLTNCVEFIDTYDNPNFFDLFKHLLNTHDIFVLPSVIAKNGDDEGGPPVVIANAQAVGLPVISTPVGGITRAIINGETGVLIQPKDVQSLTEAMCDLATNLVKVKHISERARTHVELNFNAQLQLEKIINLYDHLLKKSSEQIRSRPY
jgi:glycosyltransferase involved in cell wall biosynthesis